MGVCDKESVCERESVCARERVSVRESECVCVRERMRVYGGERAPDPSSPWGRGASPAETLPSESVCVKEGERVSDT